MMEAFNAIMKHIYRETGGKTMAVDLHTHSCCSDGSLTPSQLIGLAARQGLTAVALTDHDTVSGISEAKAQAEKEKVYLIPGIEISSLHDFGNTRKELHILGLGIDETDPGLTGKLESFRRLRDRRNKKMLQLIQSQVMDIDEGDFFSHFGNAVITRAHFAQYLCEKGAVSSVKEAFDRYLGDGKPCFVPKEGVTSRETIDCILEAGGHPVLAHPPQYRLGAAALDELTAVLAGWGLEGIETVYSTYTAAQERELRALASKYGLHMTGGSDFHGDAKPDIRLGIGRGSLCVPDEFARWLLA